jgi:hypothetical protein
MGILLHSSVGPFDESFLIRIPQLERMMAARGLDPSRFVIAKAPSPTGRPRLFGARLWDYTVFVDGGHFTVTRPDDASFLGYFITRCLPRDHAAPMPWPGGLLSRLLRRMTQPM